MSTVEGSRWGLPSPPTPRTVALVGVVALTAGYVSTLYWVTTVVGNTLWLVAVVLLAALAAVAVRRLPERLALGFAGGVGLVAAGWYWITALPSPTLTTVTGLLAEPAILASGNSVLAIAAVDVWIATLVPVPVFCSIYLALRRRYVLAALAGGWLLVLLALTGDATPTETLVGTLGIVTTVGFGEIERRDGDAATGDLVIALLAVMAVLALAVPMVPSGAASPLSTGTGLGDGVVGGFGDAGSGPGSGPGDGNGTGPGDAGERAAPVALGDQVLSGGVATPGGPIALSPDVRFVVDADRHRRWRVDALDYYTGQGWIRTGAPTPGSDSLPTPPGPSRTLDQTIEVRSRASALAAATYPVALEGLPDQALAVTANGVPTTQLPLSPGATYRVHSEVPTPTTAQLQNASTDYPEAVEPRYTQLPADLPRRVANRTDRVTSRAATPYETAIAVEAYLEGSHGYSQNVSEPAGDPVDAFLFEMDEGYCTYFASTMAAMLRTQDVPARVAVGYGGGQWAGNDTWVVRGTDAHVWVEVYFPEYGWIEFDPTPSSDRRTEQVAAIEQARENGSTAVDVAGTENRTVRFERPPETDETGDANASTGTDATDGGAATNGTGFDESRIPARYRTGGDGGSTNTSQLYVDPEDRSASAENSSVEAASRAVTRTGHRLLDGVEGPMLALVLAAGSVAGARRTRVAHRVRASTSLLWQRRRAPGDDVERAVRRLDRLLGRRYRPRRPGETRREYLAALPSTRDSRIGRAYFLHERARYAGEVDDETADELVRLVDELTREAHPVVGRLRG